MEITTENESGIREIIAQRRPNMQLNPAGAPGGLYILTEWITPEEEQQIVDFVSTQPWSDEISGARLTQHYGYRYTVNGSWKSEGKTPADWGVLRGFGDRIETQFPGVKIAQCLANVYKKDTGIAAHRDKETPIVFGVSLVGDINMVWTSMQPGPNGKEQKYEAFIPKRSLYIMTDDAAFNWKHAVPVRKRVNYPDASGNLTKHVDKPDWYIRLSITFRHFTQGTGAVDRLIPNPVPAAAPKLECVHFGGIVPYHREAYNNLLNEHPWSAWKSRFGKDLSRKICGESISHSATSEMYARWMVLFCERILAIPIEIVGSFANFYSSGTATLPAHRDDYDCWVFSLSFGATRTFQFTDAAETPVVSLSLASGDVMLFSPDINKTHKHRIPKEAASLGPRINITYFINPVGIPMEEAKSRFLNPPDLRTVTMPLWNDVLNSPKIQIRPADEVVSIARLQSGDMVLVNGNGEVVSSVEPSVLVALGLR